MRARFKFAASLVACVASTAGPARGDDHDHHRGRSTAATPHTARQAGYPQCVSPVSMASYNEHYSGGYVGGGKAFGGHEPCPHQGTWGWDYTPFRPMSSRIFLRRSNGLHAQGGTGAYATDGPRPIEHVADSIHAHTGGKE